MPDIVVILLIAGAAAGVICLIGLLVLRAWAKQVVRGGGKKLKPISAKKAGEFFGGKAAFAVVTEREYTQPPEKIWSALNANGLFSWLPFVNGASYTGEERGIGAQRVFDGNLVAAAQEVITYDDASRLTLTGTRTSIPFVMRSYAEDYQLTPTASGGTKLRWTIAAHPRLGGFFSLRIFAPIVRPFASSALKGLGTRA